jgi:hypothetical protein
VSIKAPAEWYALLPKKSGIGALYDGEAKNLLGLNNESVLLYLVAIGPVTN